MATFLAFTLCIATLCMPVLLSSCSGDGVKINEPVYAPVDHVYQAEYITLPTSDTFYVNATSMLVKNDRIWMQADDYSEGFTTDKVKYRLLSCAMDGSDLRIELFPSLHENSSVSVFTVTDDGGMIFCENYYDEFLSVYCDLVTRTTPDGTVIFSKELSVLFAEDVTDELFQVTGGGTKQSVKSLVMGANGTIYVGTDVSLVAVTGEGQKLYEIALRGSVDMLQTFGDGRVIVKYSKNMGSETHVCYLDDENKKLGEEAPVPEITTVNMRWEYVIGEGYDTYVKNDTGLFGYNSGDTEPTLLCNWINSDIVPDFMRKIQIISPEKLVIAGYSNNSMAFTPTEVAILTAVPKDQVIPKKLITLAYNNANTVNSDAIVAFNRSNDEYRVVLKNYWQYNTVDDFTLAGQQMTMDIITNNNIPDIMLFGNYIDYYTYADKGLFCDLYPIMDADKNFDRSQMLACALKPFEEDGALYKFVENFNVYTTAARSETLAKAGIGDTVTMDQLLDLADSLNDGQSLYQIYFDKNNRIQMLRYLCCYGYSCLIDEGKGTCSFDSDTFMRLLRYVNNLGDEGFYSDMTAEEREAYEHDRTADFRNDKIIFNTDVMYDFTTYLYYLFAFDFNDVTLEGFPTESGGGSYVQERNSYGITKVSAVKEGAWEFLKSLLDKKYEENVNINLRRGFPSSRAGAKKRIASLKEWYVKIRYSDQIAFPTEKIKNGEYHGGDDGVSVWRKQIDDGYECRFSDDDAAFVLAFIENIDKCEPSLRLKPVLDIIVEEASSYFAGDKTAEEVAKLIQSRVTIYLSERV